MTRPSTIQKLSHSYKMSTALIIGAGQRVGQAVADAFAKAGYNVAVASRSGKVSGDYKHFSFDATKPESAADLFAEVRESVGIPSVVIYNGQHPPKQYSCIYTDIRLAYGAAYGFKKGKPVDVQGFNADMHVNATTPFTSAMEAIKGFEELKSNGKLGPEGATFIFTGNILNDTAAPGFLAFAMQKAASAVMIKNLALVEYKDEPFK